jgi:two-component system, sensor histidine kinase YesM
MSKRNTRREHKVRYPHLYVSIIAYITYFLCALWLISGTLLIFHINVTSFTGASLPMLLLSLVIIILTVTLLLFERDINKIIRKIYEKLKKTTSLENAVDFKKLRVLDLYNMLDMVDSLNTKAQQQYPYQLLQKQAQLEALQHQINPHFLYNALESIRGLAIQQSAEETADMAEALSTLFRFSISKTSDFIPLSQELGNIDNYIKIQKYRFNNRFDLKKEIELSKSQLEEYRIPKLTLQPIVENALEHGLKNIASGGLITLRIIPTQSRLLISISDNGFGMDDGLLRSLNESFLEPVQDISTIDLSKNSGIALKNVNTRMKLIFGNRFGLTAYSTKNLGTEIQISLPLIKDGKINGQ